MKKMFLMASLILAANLCSAQFMAITTINTPEDDAEWEMSNITDKKYRIFLLSKNSGNLIAMGYTILKFMSRLYSFLSFNILGRIKYE